MDEPERDLTYIERSKWGECPVCHAAHGEACDPNQGLPLGHCSISGLSPENGVHLGRLQRAPRRVREIAVT